MLTVNQGTLVLGTGVSIPGNLAVTGGSVFAPPANGTYTASLGTGAGQLNLNPGGATGGGFGAVGGPVTINLGGAGATVTWDQGGFVPNGSVLQLGSTSSKLQ